MKVVISGINGFIGKNLRTRLTEINDIYVVGVSEQTTSEEMRIAIADSDYIFHLAGVNRSDSVENFERGNVGFTKRLCESVASVVKPIPIIYTSSLQAELDNPYGRSKLAAEKELVAHGKKCGNPIAIYRLPNVFGKWGRPNYNSVVATFCHNVARGMPIEIHDPKAPLKLIYIDDLVDIFLSIIESNDPIPRGLSIEPIYESNVGAVAEIIQKFYNSRATLLSEKVGTGLTRALYSTYLSYLPPDAFWYKIPKYEDSRGVFSEVLKTYDSGQFSYFTALPGVTRGNHYHHTKNEKFVVIKGNAVFRFQHIISKEECTLVVNGDGSCVVESIPGWAHSVTNIGEDELIVMIWASENFDRNSPDTISMRVDHE